MSRLISILIEKKNNEIKSKTCKNYIGNILWKIAGWKLPPRDTVNKESRQPTGGSVSKRGLKSITNHKAGGSVTGVSD